LPIKVSKLGQATRNLLMFASVAYLCISSFGGESPAGPPAPSQWCPEARYLLQTEMDLAGYSVRLWRSEDPDCVDRYVFQVVKQGEVKFQRTGFNLMLDPLTGKDITGEGDPDVIVRGYSGGAHCCFYTILCSLGSEVTAYSFADSPLGNCQGEFRDLDNDGIYEFVTRDDSFAYRYCCFACSPAVTVVLKLVPGKGYRPASPEFPWIFEGDVQRDLQLAKNAAQEGRGSAWDGTTKCEVLPLVLDLLYMGQIEQAWLALERYYPFPDLGVFRSEIAERVFSSPFFVPPRSDKR